ncbi:MAG: hypothetical protein Q8941_11310 [Bacteroidota bacterium]|nr:hypothetical protein [Bacteroidota bacterium]
MEQDQPPSLFELSIDQQAATTLRTASQWGRFLSVLGFILGVLILIMGFVLYNKLTPDYRGAYRGSPALRQLAIRYLIVCILLAAVFVTGAIFTLNFSNRTTTALNTQDQRLMNSGLAAIRNGIILWSVVFVIFILLTLLLFAGIYS